MKTNHQRDFVGTDDRPNTFGNQAKYGTGYGDATNGHRGQARQKAGMKKFLRTRKRFAENQHIHNTPLEEIQINKTARI